MEELKYIKTDRNGTKIFHDWTCQRCGGAGGADKWKFTGWTCHECGGSGKRTSPKIVRQYTPEHAAKLEAKARQRAEKKRAEENATFLAQNGFADDGTGYIFTGDTYPIKDTLKAGRAKWNNWLGWIAPDPIGDFPCVPVNAKDICIFDDYYRLDYDKSFEFKRKMLEVLQ